MRSGRHNAKRSTPGINTSLHCNEALSAVSWGGRAWRGGGGHGHHGQDGEPRVSRQDADGRDRLVPAARVPRGASARH